MSKLIDMPTEYIYKLGELSSEIYISLKLFEKYINDNKFEHAIRILNKLIIKITELKKVINEEKEKVNE